VRVHGSRRILTLTASAAWPEKVARARPSKVVSRAGASAVLGELYHGYSVCPT